jgi:beta-phosphoglucomutase-like phosphatase (HAD superfamily)
MPEETLIFEDSLLGIQAAENAVAGQIIIVNSNQDDYSHWSYPVIRNFDEVDRKQFID